MKNSDNESSKRDNIFEILDGTISRLNRTKNLFIIMTLTILIIPPAALAITVGVFDNPFGPNEDLIQLRREIKNLNAEYTGMFAGIEQLEPAEREKRVIEIVNSPEFLELNQKFQTLAKDPTVHEPTMNMQRGFFIKPAQSIILLVSLGWLGVGIYQSITFNKWNKRYQNYKSLQQKIDEDLEGNKG